MNSISPTTQKRKGPATLVLLLALVFTSSSALFGQAVIAKMGDDFGKLQRMKGQTIGGNQYSIVLFEKGIKALDQNAQVVTTKNLYKCKALAVQGEFVYVVGSITNTATDLPKLLKYKSNFSTNPVKFQQVGEPATFPYNIGNTSVDACITNDGKLWALNASESGYNIVRFSCGGAGESPKRDSVPSNQATNYRFDFGTGGYYLMDYKGGSSVNPLVSIGTTLQSTDPLRVVADGDSFWFAVSDQDDRHIRVGQIRRSGEWGLTCDKLTAPGYGGVPVWLADGLAVKPEVTGLAVDPYDDGFVYLTVNMLTKKQSQSQVIRFRKTYAGLANEALMDKDGNPPATPANISLITQRLIVSRQQGEDATKPVRISELLRGPGDQLYVGGVFGADTSLQFQRLDGQVSSGHILFNVGASNLFIGKLFANSINTNFGWESVSLIPEGAGIDQPVFDSSETSPPPPATPLALPSAPRMTLATATGTNLILGARIASGEAVFDSVTSLKGPNSFGLLLSSSTLEPTKKQFILHVGADGKQPNSPAGSVSLNLSNAGISPGFGRQSFDINERIVITVPDYVYQKPDGTFLNLDKKSPEVVNEMIKDVVARYRPVSYTMTRDGDPQTVTGTGNSVTVTLTSNTTVNFHFVREYAFNVSSNLAGLPGVDSTSGQALGNPYPPARKNWIEEDTPMIPQIDGSVSAVTDSATRYLCTGYILDGKTVPFTGTQTRQQVQGFNMTKSSTLIFNWKAQHSVTVSASTSDANGVVGVQLEGAAAQTGAGVYWFDRGSKVTAAASDIPGTLKMTKVFSANGVFASIDQKLSGQLNDTFVSGGKTYYGKKVDLNSGGSVSFDFGNPIYRQIVSLGSPVVIGPPSSALFRADEMLTTALAGQVDLTVSPTVVSVVSSPTGTQAANAILWSQSDRKAWPVRPGRYLLEWKATTPTGKLVTEITVGFPGDKVQHPAISSPVVHSGVVRNLRAVLHPDMPAIDLDPSTADNVAFKQLDYSSVLDPTGSTNPISVGNLTAPVVSPSVTGHLLSIPVSPASLSNGEGRHVVVFSTRTGTTPATGDLSAESLAVRVLETRSWKASRTWDDASAMIVPAVDAIIGRKLSDGLDTAGIGTGFVVGSRARYNVNVYDRTRVADAGPIFPVNVAFPVGVDANGNSEDDLTVIWYERKDGVLWPYRPAKYTAKWPATAPRIVIASQLGSDGLSAPPNRAPQFKFDPATTSGLQVYAQNDPEKAGFNPNEEHALSAGSLKYAGAQPQPVAVYALRDDLNIKASTSPNANHTSDPYVLAQYINTATGQPEMQVYKVEQTDAGLPALQAVIKAGFVSSSNGVLSIALPPSTTFYPEEAVQVRVTAGTIEGISATQTYYVSLVGGTVRLSTLPGGEVITTTSTSLSSVALTLTRLHPYDFSYTATAGLPVPFPNPLLSAVGAVPPSQLSGGEEKVFDSLDNPPAKVFYKDYKGVPWVISGGGALFNTRFFYRMQDSFWHKRKGDGTVAGTTDAGTQSAPAAPIAWLPTDSKGLEPRKVIFTAQWPSDAPVLKVGETLTFSGGEYKADNPDANGLPGVIGWASGRVVFDPLTPAMDRGDFVGSLADLNTARQRTFTSYAARLISPLETRSVSLTAIGISDADIALFKEKIAPATGIVTVDGPLWRFTNLPASLRNRLFFDPISNRLGFQGFVNDKTLGDQTLTAAPPPAYILDPNILRPSDLKLLKEDFRGIPDGVLLSSLLSPSWTKAVDALYIATRNPASLRKDPNTTASESEYYTGLDWAPQRDSSGNPYKYGPNGSLPVGAVASEVPAGFVPAEGKAVPTKFRATPPSLLGPGLALVPSPALLDPNPANAGMKKIIDTQFNTPDSALYLTVAENDDASLGLPVSMHVIKIVKKHRYRGAIKLVEGNNAFSEKVTLRHTGEFGGNTDDLSFEWFYRVEDGRNVPIPYADGTSLGAWQLFPGATSAQLDFDANGVFVLPDLWFLSRYRHKNDIVFPPASWGGTQWLTLGKPDQGFKKGELWAGAANSPQTDGAYLPQLVSGWLKRVLDRINPYEARFTDFRNNSAPATYASMIQQAGPAYNGPVALNPNKDVIENTGLIQLYQTLLERARAFGLKSAITDAALKAGVMNAIQLAATRVQDLYMVLGNDAYADTQDPLVGFGSSSTEYGSSAASIWTFMNQTATPLDEELAMLRGVSFSYGRPVFNRLFWNFTKDLGEVAYAQTYNLRDENKDGFIDEKDAMIRYPMGHGDAWGHYSTAVKMHYDLLKETHFAWQPRSEYYSLVDTVIPVDFYDERKFAAAAAARARAGADIVSLTYRQRYTENTDGQWQGYTDTDTDRGWGVQEWSRRAGQCALLDWAVANSMLPAQAENRGATKAIASVSAVSGGQGYNIILGSGVTLPKQDSLGNAIRYLLVVTDASGNTQEINFQPTGTTQSTTLFLFPVADNAPSLNVQFAAGKPLPGLTVANFSLAVLDRPEGIQKVDRSTVDALSALTREHARIENTVLDANGGLNPLGLAKDSVPFDIDPALYTGRNGTQPVSHFEQIYERARKAVANARVIFDGATEAQNALRQNQDGLETFSNDVADHDRELRNRLIEIFGTPHAGNIGTGKAYPAGYNGPDLFFSSYVDVNDVSAGTVPYANPGDDTFKVLYNGFKQQLLLTDGNGLAQKPDGVDNTQVTDFESVFQKYFFNDLDADMFTDSREVSIVDNSPLVLNLPIRAKGYAFKTPAGWGLRAQTGEVQTLISDLVRAEADLALALDDYNGLIGEIGDTAETLAAQYASALESITSQQTGSTNLKNLAVDIAELRFDALGLTVGAETAEDLAGLYADSKPDTFIFGTATGSNIIKALTGIGIGPFLASKAALRTAANALEMSALMLEPELEIENFQVAINEAKVSAKYELASQLIALKAMLGGEGPKRIAVLQAQEVLRQASDAYRTKLNAGYALIDERAEFNRRTAGIVQEHRYQDMTYRVFWTEGLDKYHAAFDLAARYTWLAAKAYEYETNLPANHPASASSVLEDIVKARLIGDMANGEPVLGDGLANALASLRDNYGVLKGQLGLNNGQAEDSTVSLRSELFRRKASSDASFRADLNGYRVLDLNLVPEFRRFCRPFAPATTAQPGLVIPMPTTITAGKNIFNKDLGPGDHSFDPSLFATKVSGVGVWFDGYDLSKFANAPRVYLVPAGDDAMLEPTSTTFVPRYWTIVDQRIPVPQPLGASPLGVQDWRPVTDTLDGLPGEIRKFSSFRAYSGSTFNLSQLTFDSRLVGRSVWNTRWLLIIPGQTLGSNATTSLNDLLGANGITDIRLVFKTFGFSGN